MTETIATPETPAVWSVENIENPELRDFAINKGYHKGAPEEILPKALDSYRNLEKLFGADKAGKTVLLPDPTDPKSADAFFAKLGRPETPDKYDLALPEGTQETEFTKTMRETFHKSGLTAEQAKTLAGAFNEFSTKAQEAEQTRVFEAGQQSQAELEKEWGAAYKDRVAKATAAAQALGASGEAIEAMEKAMGYGAVMKFFANAASKIGEDKFISGDPMKNANAPMSPAEARAEISRLNADPAHRAIMMNPKHPEHKALSDRRLFLAEMQTRG